MGIDIIRNILKRNKVELDMFTNKDSDNCKDKYNNLIYLLTEFIVESKDINLNKLSSIKYSKLLNYNKDAIILYLNLVEDVLTNQTIDETILDNKNMSFITDLNGNLNLNTLEGKKLVLNQIRNAYAHKSGKIYFFEDNGVKKVKIDNKSWFSIEAKLDDLNKLFKDITIVDSNNEIQTDIEKTIECVQTENYKDIPEDAAIILKLNLLMCYNKESIFDRFMQTQTSFIDASKFEINSTANWNYTEASLRRSFFDKFDIFFHSDSDKDSYINEWKPIVDIYSNVVLSGIKYTYNTKNMPFDTYTQKHIPIPLFLTALRNANCHGRIRIQGDKIVFYDQNNGSTSQPYFYMSIDKKDLLEFLSSDYFDESIFTTIDKHQNEHNLSLYLLERAESANNFANYMDIYKSRLQSLSEIDVIKFMYDNNKFSSYLMEYPKQVDEFLNYKLSDGTLLINLIESFYIGPNMNKKRVRNDSSHYFKEGVKIYDSVLTDELEALNTIEKEKPSDYDPLLKILLKYKGSYKISLDENYAFFNMYYAFLRNLKSIQPNINPVNISELTEEEKNIILAGSEALKEEFLDNGVILDPKYISDIRTLIEIGMQQSRKSEFSKIKSACAFAETIKKDAKEETEERRYTITNVEKRSNISKIYKFGIANKIASKTDEANRLHKLLWINIGLIAFRNLALEILKKTPYYEIPALQWFFSITFGAVMISNHFDMFKSLIKMLRSTKAAKADIESLKKYLDRSDLDVFGLDGQDNIKRK